MILGVVGALCPQSSTIGAITARRLLRQADCMEILARLEAATTTICVHSTLSRTPCRTCLCVGLASLPDCRKRIYICAISCLLATVDCPILVLCNMPVHSCCGCDGRTVARNAVRSQQLQSLDGNAVNWTAIYQGHACDWQLQPAPGNELPYYGRRADAIGQCVVLCLPGRISACCGALWN